MNIANNDKFALWTLIVSAGAGIGGAVAMAIMGLGWLSLIPLVIPVFVAEVLGKVRNGI